jgi:16S rRNA (guanine966-N2)-methyltransferase
VPRKRKRNETSAARRHPAADAREAEVRIIGGEFRGRRLQYHGDRSVRPMKHRTREAIFNLISTECAGRHAIDLFAGTGALGLEALSRGAATATLIEKHVPTARVIEANIRALGVENRATLLITSAFLWAKRDLPDVGRTILSIRSIVPSTDRIVRPTAERPWLVFCSPPYAFYHERQSDMLELIQTIQTHTPPDSIVVVEADEQFDFDLLRERNPRFGDWDVRSYAPAIVGLWRRTDR